MEVEDVVGGHGRFAEYPSTFTGYPHMNYLPRLTRSHLGEEQVWEFLVPANPSCDGTWTLAYETTSTRDDSSYGPVVQVWDPIGAEWDYAFDVDPDDLLQDLPGLARSGVYLSGTGAVSDVLSTGQPVRFGWGIKNIDGASELGSPIGPTALAWSIEPPVGCPQPLLTQSASFTDERVPDFFDRIGCVLTTSETAACWLGAPPILGGDWSDMFGGAP